ncbi:MAG: thermonuclease family protein [Campylobacterota bacterium]|nr:thermonuclease family protein [Campylobacterota bacterium]
MRTLLLFLFLELFLTLKAQEPTLGQLVNVYSNQYQKFKIGNFSFTCKPYGVITLGMLQKQALLNSECKSAISEFYKRAPKGKYYAQRVLKVKQFYSLEFKESECLVYSNGQKTFSESLLEEGLALLEPKFKDNEFKASFYYAQENAKLNQNGVWKENILRKCVVELYK